MSHIDPAQTMLWSEMTIRFLNVNLESDTWNIQRLSWGSSHPDVSAPPFVLSTSALFTYLSEHQSISSLRFIKLLFPHPVFYRDLEPLLFIHASMHQKCTLRCPVEPHRLLPNKHTTPLPKHTSYTSGYNAMSLKKWMTGISAASCADTTAETTKSKSAGKNKWQLLAGEGRETYGRSCYFYFTDTSLTGKFLLDKKLESCEMILEIACAHSRFFFQSKLNMETIWNDELS